jgi:cbb3-type cytochrome oxidase subunit 3
MRMSDLVSNMTPSTMTEIALVLFVAVFLAISIRTLRHTARARCEEAARLPLCDDAYRASDADASSRSAR